MPIYMKYLVYQVRVKPAIFEYFRVKPANFGLKLFYFQFFQISGNLGDAVLERYVKVMIEENDSNEAYNAIVFCNSLKYVDTAEELAVLAGQKLTFEKQQNQTLNSLFSSSSKWKML